MFKPLLRSCLLAMLWGFSAVSSAQTPEGKDGETPSTQIQNQLFRRVDFKGIKDSQTTLVDALEAFSERYDLVVLVDTLAFRDAGMKNVEDFRIAVKPIPEMQDARIEAVLRALLARIPVRSGAIFLVRLDYIEVTTRQAAMADLPRRWKTLKVAAAVLPINSKERCKVLVGIFGDRSLSFPEKLEYSRFHIGEEWDELKTLIVNAAYLKTLIDTELSLIKQDPRGGWGNALQERGK